MSQYKIGTATNNKVDLATLITRDPQPAFAHYANYVRLGNGDTRGVGWIQAEWRWNLITVTEITALKTYCTGINAAVYITTPDGGGTFTGYSATMVWPQIAEPRVGEYIEDFVIEFIEMVAAGGTT